MWDINCKFIPGSREATFWDMPEGQGVRLCNKSRKVDVVQIHGNALNRREDSSQSTSVRQQVAL
jgi:hypothetical protein